jgi:hypothetical protein
MTVPKAANKGGGWELSIEKPAVFRIWDGAAERLTHHLRVAVPQNYGPNFEKPYLITIIVSTLMPNKFSRYDFKGFSQNYFMKTLFHCVSLEVCFMNFHYLLLKYAKVLCETECRFEPQLW